MSAEDGMPAGKESLSKDYHDRTASPVSLFDTSQTYLLTRLVGPGCNQCCLNREMENRVES